MTALTSAEKARIHREKNRPEYNAYMREWWAKNPAKRDRFNAKRKAAKRSSPVNFLLRKAKERAKERGCIFTLTAADLLPLPNVCPVLGIPLAYDNPKQGPNSPTLDRIDNNGGYTKDNVLLVSWRANNLKSDATAAELRALARFYAGENVDV